MEINTTDGLVAGNIATVRMNDGDTLCVGYVDAAGATHILNITTMHLVLLVQHEQTGAGILFRPSAPNGYQFVKE